MPKIIGGVPGDHFDTEITEAQFDSYVKLVQRYKEVPRIIHCGGPDPYLGCQFKNIMIGIEPDGYAHS